MKAEILFWIPSNLNQFLTKVSMAILSFFPTFYRWLISDIIASQAPTKFHLQLRSRCLPAHICYGGNDILEWTENGILQNWSFLLFLSFLFQ